MHIIWYHYRAVILLMGLSFSFFRISQTLRKNFSYTSTSTQTYTGPNLSLLGKTFGNQNDTNNTV